MKYKIPFTLEVSLFDSKTELKSKNGFGIDKEISIRSMIVFGGATVLLWYIVNRPLFLQNGSKFGTILFTIGFYFLIYLMLRELPIPGLYGFNMIPAMFNYISKKRHKADRISTAVFGEYDRVAMFTGMVEPDWENGLLNFINGDVGRMYHITGEASRNIFDDDRERTINQFANLLRNLENEVAHSIITTVSGQNTQAQIEYLFELKVTEVDRKLVEMIDKDIDTLKNHVEGRYKTLHQYMVIRAADTDLLESAQKIVQQFASTSNVIDRFKPPTAEEQIEIFKVLYQGMNLSTTTDRKVETNS